MKQKLTTKSVLAKEEYWGDDGMNEGFIKRSTINEVDAKSDLPILRKAKAGIRSYINNMNLSYNESIRFEREYRRLCIAYTKCYNHLTSIES